VSPTSHEEEFQKIIFFIFRISHFYIFAPHLDHHHVIFLLTPRGKSSII